MPAGEAILPFLDRTTRFHCYLPMIRFRPLSAADYPLLLEWLQRPHVKAWWDDGDDTLEKVAAHFARDPENTKRFIIELDGRDTGFIQYHRAGHGHVGIDITLARAEDLNQGLGTCCLNAFIDSVRALEEPQTLTIDPEPENKRAIRCYEKCGFRHQPEKSSAGVYFMT